MNMLIMILAHAVLQALSLAYCISVADQTWMAHVLTANTVGVQVPF